MNSIFLRRTRTALIALFALLGSTPAMAQDSALVGADNSAGALGPYMEYLIDPDGSMDFASARNSPQLDNGTAEEGVNKKPGVWHRVDGDNINGGFTDSVYWVRFSVKNTTDKDAFWILEVKYALLDHIELYIPDSNDHYTRTVSGDRLPFSQRPIEYRNFAAPIKTKAHSGQTLYLRFESESSMHLDLQMWPDTSFAESMDGQLLVFGLLYGFVCLAGIYCLINAIFMRQRMYSFIAIAIFGSAGYSLSLNGFGYQYLWPESPWLQSISVPLFLNICYGFALFYSREFLNLKRSSRFTDNMIFAWGIACLVVAGLSLFVSYSSIIRISTVFAISVSMAALWAGVVSLLSGNQSARYFVVGWSALVVGALTFALKALGEIPSNLFTVWMQEFGFAGTAFFLTLAQSDRFFQTQRQHQVEQAASLQAVRSAEKKYRSLFENAIEGIFQLSLDGHLLHANTAFAGILGSDNVNDLLAQSHPAWSLHCLPESERDKFKSLLDQQQALTAFETSFTRPSGETRWIGVSVQRIQGTQEDASHYEGAMADITESKKRQQAEKQKRMAEASTEAKSLFLANMSHEIRTPMNAIIGFTDLALQNNRNPQLTDYLQKTRVASNNLLGIINDILDFSKIEAGKLEIEQIPFSLQEVLNNLSNIVSVNIASRQLALTITVDKDIPDQLVGDPLRIGQVLLNLTNNAIKFTAQGEVDVRLELVSLNKRDRRIVLRGSVRDTGIGIAPEKLGTLFSSFTQADESTTRRFGGTGLGLSISRQLVEMMGGAFSVESEVGKGSTFSFTLTCGMQDQRTDQAGDSDTPGELHFAGLDVLLVEDVPMNQELAYEILTDRGIRVSLANNGQEGVDAVAQGRFDLVLMDMQMPVMDGCQASEKIRLFNRKLPIIAMTANAMAADRNKCLAAGMNDYVTKPINTDELFRVMARWVKSSRPAPVTQLSVALAESPTPAADVLPDSSEAKPEFEPAELAQRLDALMPLIRARKLEACDLAADYLQRWPRPDQAPLLKEIIKALDAFDFSRAETLVRNLVRDLVRKLNRNKEK